MRALDWHLAEETQQEAIEWLVKYIPREQLSLLFSPHTEKSCWQNAVQVVARIGYTENEAALPHLVELFQDLNWPGAQEIQMKIRFLLMLIVCATFGLVGCSNEKQGLPTSHEAVNNLEGVTMRIKEGTASSTGMTVVLENKTDKKITYGTPYTLEKSSDGNWFEVLDILNGNYAFIDIGYNLDPSSTNEWEVDWQWLYGKLDKGEYRLVKDVSDFRQAGDFDRYYLAVEFEIR